MSDDKEKLIDRIHQQIKQDLLQEKEKTEKELKEKKQQEKERLDQEKYNKKNWKKIAWSEKEPEFFEYAIWHFYKRLILINISWIPFYLFYIYTLSQTYKEINFFTILLFNCTIGIMRAIATQGTNRSYDFFKIKPKERFIRRFSAFVLGLFFSPIMLLVHIYDSINVAVQVFNPPPPVYLDSGTSEPDYSTDEEYVGRIDADGNIYKKL
jgi:hypothetical protein